MIQQTNLLHRSSRAVACALVACTLATPLAAASSDSAESSWQFEATPYLWATGLDGALAITARPQAGIAEVK
jgi:hypothetical protein